MDAFKKWGDTDRSKASSFKGFCTILRSKKNSEIFKASVWGSVSLVHSKSLQHSEKLHSSAVARTTSLEHKLLEWNKTPLAEQEISKTHWKSTLITACTNQMWCIGKNAWPILERWSYSLHDPRAISAKCDKYANVLSQPAMNPWCERNIRPNLGLSNLWHAVIPNLPFFNDISLISFQHRRSFRLHTSTFFEDLGESWGKLWAKMLVDATWRSQWRKNEW